MDDDFDFNFIHACKQVRIPTKQNKRLKKLSPYKALYSLKEVTFLLPYEERTIRKMALGIITNTLGLVFLRKPGTEFPHKGGRARTNKAWFVPRDSLVEYFNSLEVVH